MSRAINLCLVQPGPASPSKEENIQRGLNLIDLAAQEPVDLIVFPEMFTTQFFCVGFTDPKFMDLAETIPGPATQIFGEKARERDCHILLPIYEKGPREGEFYNSAVLIGPDGKVIEGILPDGTRLPAARKNYISHFRWGEMVNDEKFYFRLGSGHPVFETDLGKIGCLICYERWFPEGWRVLALNGAELILLPIGDLYTMSPKEAAYACRLMDAKKVIPMHFGTFPPLEGTPRELQELTGHL